MTRDLARIENLMTVDSKSLALDFINYCDVCESTQKSYFKAAVRFLNYLAKNSILTLTRNDVIRYRENLKGTVAPTTARLYFTIAKIFIGWLATKKVCSRDILDNVKSVKLDYDTHLRTPVTLEECRASIEACGEDTEKQLREKACIALMAVNGLRSVEVVRLNRSDFFRRSGRFFLAVLGKGKNNKVEVPLPANVAAIIQSYLNLRSKRGKIEGNAPLFVATSNRNRDCRLQTQTISRMAKRILRKIGVDDSRKNCHSFRAGAANIALDSNCDTRKISKFLRHRSLLTTEIYLRDRDFNDTADIISYKIFKKG